MTQLPSPTKVVCIARNYLDHIKELNNVKPASPVFFMKPTTAIVPLSGSLKIPTGQGECHHELELALWIGQNLSKATAAEAEKAVAGYGIGLDLTLRDLQTKLKEKGHPWEAAKAFDGSLPLSEMIAASEIEDPQDTMIELKINNETRQKDSTNLMLTPIFEMIALISQSYTLNAGDVVLTGTPKGVGPLLAGDQLEVILAEKYSYKAEVAP